jgi:cytosine/uracil/thiamine/allantoin permease
MFKRVISHEGFWKSVVSLAIAFAVLFIIIKWAIDGFSMDFITERNPLYFFLGVIAAGLVYGFFVTFGKFRARLKKEDQKK